MDVFIRKTDQVVNKFLAAVTMVMLSAMAVVVFAQVVSRFVHVAIPWAQEFSQYTLIWTTFLGGALCIRKGAFTGLEIIYKIFPEKMAKGVTLVINALSAIFLLFLVIVGYRTSGLIFGQTSAVLKVSMGLMYAAIPTGSLFMLINICINSYYVVKGEDRK